MGPDFQRAAQRMAPLVRSLLVEHADPAKVPVDSLLIALGRRGDHAAIRAARKEFDVLHVPAALSSASCASLRSAVDCERRLLADSVDQCPEHQRNLNSEELEKHIKRTDLLEQHMDKEHSEMKKSLDLALLPIKSFKFIVKFALGMAAIAGLVKLFTK